MCQELPNVVQSNTRIDGTPVTWGPAGPHLLAAVQTAHRGPEPIRPGLFAESRYHPYTKIHPKQLHLLCPRVPDGAGISTELLYWDLAAHCRDSAP